MNLSNRTSPTNPVKEAKIEIAFFKDAHPALLENVNCSPEAVSPTCPMKLHSFMVIASFETKWHRKFTTSENLFTALNKN